MLIGDVISQSFASSMPFFGEERGSEDINMNVPTEFIEKERGFVEKDEFPRNNSISFCRENDFLSKNSSFLSKIWTFCRKKEFIVESSDISSRTFNISSKKSAFSLTVSRIISNLFPHFTKKNLLS